MLSLVRTGSAGLVGVASGALNGQPPLMLGTTAINWGTVAEAVALAGGAGLQLMSPHTMPNLADGLVDGSVALLLRRGTVYAMEQTQAAPYGVPVGAQALGGYAPYAMPSYDGGGRAQVGSIGGTTKKKIQ